MPLSEPPESVAEPRFGFPRWANYLLPAGVIGAIGLATYLPTVAVLGLSPWTTDVGYRPQQPVPFDHGLHVKGLGMDCRYCHNTVEHAAFAAVPPTQTCMNCHSTIKPDSAALAPVRKSFAEGDALPWKKVHDLPDYVYFNHAAHVAKGVGCANCHGEVHEMTQVFQSQPLSMAWCLDCHRDPQPHLRPPEEVTNMDWQAMRDGRVPQSPGVAPRPMERTIADPTFMTSCSTCHR